MWDLHSTQSHYFNVWRYQLRLALGFMQLTPGIFLNKILLKFLQKFTYNVPRETVNIIQKL